MKKQIMKRAWEIYRELVGDHRAKLAMAMQQAWAEAKAPVNEITAHLWLNVYEVRPVADNGVELVKIAPVEKAVTRKVSNGIYRSRYEMIAVDPMRPNFDKLSGKAFVIGETYEVREGLKKAAFSWSKIAKVWMIASNCKENDANFLKARAKENEIAQSKNKISISKDDADYYSINGGHELGKFDPNLLRHRYAFGGEEISPLKK